MNWARSAVLFRKYLGAFLLPLLLILGFFPGAAAGRSALDDISSLVDNGAYAVTKRGKFIAVHNLHELYAPASIIKIATALAALEILGPEYRFSTGFYLDDRQNLYIKGFGDPFLISEEIGLIAVNLKKRGCTAVRDIYIDDSSYAVSGMTAGAGLSDNPYDAQNSGLAVNFNTVNIRRDRDGMVVSAEEQTPTIPLMAELAEGQKSGTYRISITRAHSNGAAIISRYAGELFRAFLQKENIVVSGVISRRRTPDELQPFYLHRSSKTLKEIIAPLMRYSNNFIANQLFLAAGAARNGYPATWKKGREAMTHFLQNELSLAGNEVKIVEGSGLSPANRVSAYAMIKLLDSFKPFALLLPRKDSKLLKSGTLQGVYSYAGYFMENKRLDSFVLLLNQPANNRDRLLRVLEQLYRKEEPPE